MNGEHPESSRLCAATHTHTHTHTHTCIHNDSEDCKGCVCEWERERERERERYVNDRSQSDRSVLLSSLTLTLTEGQNYCECVEEMHSKVTIIVIIDSSDRYCLDKLIILSMKCNKMLKIIPQNFTCFVKTKMFLLTLRKLIRRANSHIWETSTSDFRV